MQNWTYQKTISTAETFAVQYRFRIAGPPVTFETRSDSVSFASISEVLTEYTTLEYLDKDGKRQVQDVVANTISTTTTCVGAANPTRWKSKLEAGSPAFPGALLIKRTETFNKYIITQDGPVETEVTTYEYEPRISFAGGLSIEDYKNIDLGVGNILLRKTIVEKEQNKSIDLTKQTTVIYEAWGATAAGKTVAASIMAGLKRAEENDRISGTYTLVDRMSALVCRGVEKTINIGRGTAPAQPNKLDQENERLQGAQDTLNTNGSWNQFGPLGKPYESQYVDMSFGSDGTNSTDKYNMEFAPDSYLRPATDAGDNGTGLKYVYVSSATAAYEYGRAIHYILSGMANGKSITTELRNIPSEPMGTLYLEAAGTVGRFRANGTTFAWDSQGLVVGCDAMLDGGAGLVTGASGADWFPMMVAATNLPTVTATVNSTPALANTITAPGGFDPMAPGNIWASFGTTGVEGDVYAADLTRASVVGAVAENVRRESVSRSLTWVLEAPYSLTATTESLVSVTVNYGTASAVYEMFAGSGSGVIADLSAATGGGGGSGAAALAFTGGTSIEWSSQHLAYGWSFTLSTAKTIQGVGFYDEGQNGLNDQYGILLHSDDTYDSGNFDGTSGGGAQLSFDASGNVMEMLVPSGTTATLDGSWRRVNLVVSGRTLAAGIYFLACSPYNYLNQDNIIRSATGVTTASGVTFGRNYRYNTSYQPSTISSSGTAFFGPMIFFE
jgi:hypothetical protein